MSRTPIDKQNRAIFGARFSEQFQKWKCAEKGRTQESFGQLFDPPVRRGTVANWCIGKTIPNPYNTKRICEIFGVTDNYFNPDTATHDELYKNSSNFIEGIGKKHVDFARLIGLDLDLVRSLSNCVDFDKLFPVYSPIDHETVDPETSKKIYDREVDFMDSAHVEDVDEKLRFLQVEQKMKRITLHRCDLAFLKEVQDQIINYVEFLFYKRTEEMKREVEEFNNDLTIEEVRSNGEIVIRHKGITKDYYIEHDRFARYNYIFPDEPKPEWYSIYKPKSRRATQEDWDRYFGGDITLEDGGAAEIKKEGK